MTDRNVHAILQSATANTSDSNTTSIVRIIKRCYQHLRSTFQNLWRRNNLYDLVQQIINIICRFIKIRPHPAIFGRTIHNREIKLILCSVKITHQIKYHLIDLFRTAVWLIDLVNNNYRFQPKLQRLLENETSLRHRTFKGINKKQTTICHIEHTFYLTTEV